MPSDTGASEDQPAAGAEDDGTDGGGAEDVVAEVVVDDDVLDDDVLDDDVVDDDVVDELPEDLDATGFVGPYTFPNNNRRRIPATIYLLLGAACVVAVSVVGTDAPLLNVGVLWAGVLLVAFGAYGLVAGWTLRIDETEALSIASGQVGFAVGHASAQQVWRGWTSRPTWRILLYSAENPPSQRGIVLLDGVSGEVVEWFAEDNPEDWSGLDPSRTGLADPG